MSPLQYQLTIMALCCVIPPLIVLVVLYLGQLRLERRIEESENTMRQVRAINDAVAAMQKEVNQARAMVDSLEESFSHLNQKIIARNRVEAQAAERAEKKNKEKDDEVDLFPAPVPVPSNGGGTKTKKRLFGQF